VLRLENLDTDLRPHPSAIEATKRALDEDAWNSYLPFQGSVALREEVARHVGRLSAQQYSADEVCITCGGTEGVIDALFATTDPGDEVVLTDPTYAGLVNRVRLSGGVPRFAPLIGDDDGFRLGVEQLSTACTERTRALMLMSPSMPSGCVFTRADWEAIARLCRERDLWLIYVAAMERILFDGRELVHPASLLRDRTLIVGSASKELRLIGWRIGWVAGPREILSDVTRAHIYNAVTVPGAAQAGVLAALQAGDADVSACVAEWQRRRDALLAELRGLPVIPPHGGWSLLLDVGALGLDPRDASARLLERGKIAATPMNGWGDREADRYLRFVFANEPLERLRGLRERVLGALA
jgi:aspartate/methionine/tyrosine aminotransferase